MAKSEKEYTVVELQARWDKIRIANLYDTLDKMGYGNQCVDLGIRPLFPHQHLAGVAIPCRGGRDPRTREQIEKETKGERTVFEAEFVKDGKEIEIKVAPDGTLLKRKVEREDDDEDDDR